jgi:hypothetical protein
VGLRSARIPYEDEKGVRCEHLRPATRVQFREGAPNWVDTPFLQATTFEHERRTPNAERQTPNAKRRTPNAKRLVRKGGLEMRPSMPRNILVQNAFDLSDGFRVRY